MSTTTLTYPKVLRVRHALAIGLIAILILISVALIASAILVIVSSTTPDAYQADSILVAQNLIIPVPTPPTAEIQPIPASLGTREPYVIPLPVPTPALS
jgi:hypothetical protein